MRHRPTLALLPLAAFGDERNVEFHSGIPVRTDAVIEVTETIRARAERQQVRRGLYGDFATRYRDRYGNRVVVDWQAVLANLRDSHGNPYHPAWYDGSWSGSRLGSHAASLGSSFTSAISYSMTPPVRRPGAVAGWRLVVALLPVER